MFLLDLTMKKFYSTVLLTAISTICLAQLNFSKPSQFTRKDSLRGTLSSIRACFDVKFYDLALRVDIAKKYITGSNEISFEMKAPSSKIQIDLFANMKVNSVTWKNKVLIFSREENAIFIEFPTSLPKGSYEKIKIDFEGNPIVAKRAPWDGGFVFSKDQNDKDFVGVACQGTGASLWWPNKDHQSDEPDSMIITIACRSDLQQVSNGRLRSKKILGDGFTEHKWFVSNPINNYNVTVNIGDYVHWSDTFISKINGRALSLDYYVLRANEEKARKQFSQVKPMLTIFEKRFGPYAFYEDGYKLVETPYLGMEHQSCIAYGNAYKNGYRGFDLSGSGEGMKFDYIIIHETAHEWWGNSLTSYDIADMWIHEGFGQYSEVVYLEEMYGKASATLYLNGIKKGIENKEPIVGPMGLNTEGSGDMYPKGALFLNTLRNTINNDELWWSIILELQKKYHKKNVSTEEVMVLMNQMSGLDLSPLFKQYLYYPALPKLIVDMKPQGKDLLLTYYWESDASNFKLPIQIETKNGTKRLEGTNTSQQILLKKTKKEGVKVNQDLFYFSMK